MKQLGAVLFIAGIVVAGGSALAEKKCAICHFEKHDSKREGDVVLVGASAWEASHGPHGDCLMYQDWEQDGVVVRGHSADGNTCTCDPIEIDGDTLP